MVERDARPQVYRRDVLSFSCLRSGFAVSAPSTKEAARSHSPISLTFLPNGDGSHPPAFVAGRGVLSIVRLHIPFRLYKTRSLRRDSGALESSGSVTATFNRHSTDHPPSRHLSNQSYNDLLSQRDAVDRSPPLHTNSRCLSVLG